MLHQRSVLIEGARCSAAGVSTAVDPEHHRQGGFRWPRPRNYIEKQAIFLAGFSVVFVPVSKYGLGARSAE